MRSISKSASSCSSDDDAELRRGPWTVEEDALLIRCISSHGEGRWNMLAKLSGLKRTGKSCRLRWLNYLKPDVKRGNLTPEEQLLILELHSKWGNRWSKIAQHLPGRTDNEIKNYWRTRVQKQARHLKVDSSSKEFQELVQSVWMPRLLQKIQGSSALWDSSVSLQINSDETQAFATNSSGPTQASCYHAPLCMSEASHHLDNYHNLMYPTPTMENGNSPSVSSSDSTNISQAPRISGFSDRIPLDHDMDQGHYYNECQNGRYKGDNTSYDMETFCPGPYTVMGGSKLDPACIIYSGENDVVGDELAYGLWNNMDELWPLSERRSS